jgi:hypothetical protein
VAHPSKLIGLLMDTALFVPGTPLGEVAIPRQELPGLAEALADFSHPGFEQLNAGQRFERICRALHNLIRDAPHESFLLPALVEFLDHATRRALLESSINQSGFEMWLNNCSYVDAAENYRTRAKLVGKYLPRQEYQALFPIGMTGMYPGSHFVTAHDPPDLDTITASFWGWVDAFGARVGDAIHLWNVPGGLPPAAYRALLEELIHPSLFARVAKSQNPIRMVGRDLLTVKNLIKLRGYDRISEVNHDRYENAVIIVDEQGFYQGDWRSSDLEGVRQVLGRLEQCLQWLENHIHLSLISLFTRENLKRSDLEAFIARIQGIRLADCAPVAGYSARQRQQLDQCLATLLQMPGGLAVTFGEFGQVMDRLSAASFAHFGATLGQMLEPTLYERSGYLRENRPRLFNLLEHIYQDLDRAIHTVYAYNDRLDLALGVKRKVLGYPPNYVTTNLDVEAIRAKMGAYSHLTVAYQDQTGHLTPVGIVRSQDLRRQPLGTVSLRDFSNLEEITLAPYLQVISVVDHHKATLTTQTPPLTIVGDVQSTNTLLAQVAFGINDRYSLGGQTADGIARQLAELTALPAAQPADLRRLRRLYQYHMNAQARGEYYIHPAREFAEYLSFLNAILDDTDLLTKTTQRDIECVAELLNRLRSLVDGQVVEIVCFDDLPRDEQFVRQAAKRLLQHPELYSFYRRIFQRRQQAVEQAMRQALAGDDDELFSDTKIQNGGAAVGQLKLFQPNFAFFTAHAAELRARWLARAASLHQHEPQLDLHVQMISTIAGAEEARHGMIDDYDHRDELWLWVPTQEQATERLLAFLQSFRGSPGAAHLLGPARLAGNFPTVRDHLARHFPDLPLEQLPAEPVGGLLLILPCAAAKLNSRKAHLTPHLPHKR